MLEVFYNLVVYDQHVPQSSLQSIVPDVATAWSWNEDGTELILPKASRGMTVGPSGPRMCKATPANVFFLASIEPRRSPKSAIQTRYAHRSNDR
jgi:peptide/nickel transport system substrate-binding protein